MCILHNLERKGDKGEWDRQSAGRMMERLSSSKRPVHQIGYEREVLVFRMSSICSSVLAGNSSHEAKIKYFEGSMISFMDGFMIAMLLR